MTEEQFLEEYIFAGLTNRNTGFDAATIKHFSEEDFETIMNRIENYNLTILGIECWTKQRIRTVKFIEDYKDHSLWHRTAFVEMRSKHRGCIFSGTYEVPAELLKPEQ